MNLKGYAEERKAGPVALHLRELRAVPEQRKWIQQHKLKEEGVDSLELQTKLRQAKSDVQFVVAHHGHEVVQLLPRGLHSAGEVVPVALQAA